MSDTQDGAHTGSGEQAPAWGAVSAGLVLLKLVK